MTLPQAAGAPVSTILLASDLGARCDRATDRAADLARVWGAHLRIVSATTPDGDSPSWRGRISDAQALAHDAIGRQLAGRNLDWSLSLVAGEPAPAILDVARSTAAGLIVTGMARNELLGRDHPGKTVEALIRAAAAPLLTVRNHAGDPYRRLMIPVNFSDVAMTAALTALRMFPDAQVTLLHAYRVAFGGSMVSESGHRAEALAEAEAARDDFLARLDAATGQAGAVGVVMAYGEAERVVADYVADERPDLVVLGAEPREGPLAGMLHGAAERLLMAARTDVLVIPAG